MIRYADHCTDKHGFHGHHEGCADVFLFDGEAVIQDAMIYATSHAKKSVLIRGGREAPDPCLIRG